MGARAHAMSQKSTTRPQTLSNQQRYRNIACGRRLYLDAFRPRFDHVSTTNRPSTDHNRPSFDHQLTTKRLFRQEKKNRDTHMPKLHRLALLVGTPKPLLHRLQVPIWSIAIAVSRRAKQGPCKCMTVKRIVRCFANSLNLVSNLIEFGQQIQ